MKLKKIFFISLPIGNYQDITTRAEETLNKVDAFLGENKKATIKNLDLLKIEYTEKKVYSIKDYPSLEKKEELFKFFLNQYEKIAFIVDVGMPILADPGFDFFSLALSYQLSPTIIGGVSSITYALAYANFSIQQFYFAGFLSQKKNLRHQEIYKLKFIKSTLIIMESHHRLGRLLKDLQKQFPSSLPVYLGFSLSTDRETHFRGSLKKAINQFSQQKNNLPFVLVLNNR